MGTLNSSLHMQVNSFGRRPLSASRLLGPYGSAQFGAQRLDLRLLALPDVVYLGKQVLRSLAPFVPILTEIRSGLGNIGGKMLQTR